MNPSPVEYSINPRKWSTLFAICMLACFAPELHGQRPVACDSTIFVSAQLAEIMNVREELREWIAPGITVQLLFEEPALENEKDVRRRLLRSYPSHLRDRGIGGTTVFAVRIDSTGTPVDHRILLKSSHPDLDRAALSTILAMRAEPPRIEQGCAVPMVMRQQVVFRAQLH